MQQMVESTPVLRAGRNRIEDDLDGRLIAHAGIHHKVKAMPPGPVDIEIPLDEIRAVAIHRLGQLNRFLFAFAGRPQPSDPFLEGSVDENMKGVRAMAEIIS